LKSEINPELVEKLEELIIKLMRRVHTKMDDKIAYGITGSQFFVMKSIYERGRATVSTVAEDIGVSLSAITALVDKLAKAGYVTRSRDGEDRRLVWLEVTAQGEEVLRNCLAGRRLLIKEFLARLSENDLEQLVNIYKKMLDL
jgi:DNA-binding MarR family transcriptional regulator